MESYKGGHLSPGMIESYLGGNMNKAEAHKLESHLNLCTLCAEAVEGYREFPEHIHGFGKQKSSEKANSGRFIALPVQTLGWAASVLLVIAAVVYVLTGNPEPARESTVAMKNETDSKDFPVQNEQITDESKNLTNNPSATSENIREEAIPERVDVPTTNELDKIQEAAEVERELELDVEVQEDIPDDVNPAASAVTGDLISDIPAIADADSEPVAAEARAKQEVLQLPAARSVPKKSEFNNETGNSSAILAKPVPVIGFAAYRKYLSDSLIYPDQAIKKHIEGEVWVKFYVEPNGNLRDFRIDKSLCADCDQEAIRLIEEGPEWRPAHRQGMDYRAEALVKVVFNLPD